LSTSTPRYRRANEPHNRRPHRPLTHRDRVSVRIPRHPSAPLFPYTALFRSALARLRRRRQDRRQHQPQRRCNGVLETRRIPERTDRKSTRLNSSHVKISYAVFCLKKKHANEYPPDQQPPLQRIRGTGEVSKR